MIIAAIVPSTGAANGVLLKYGIGMAFWIAGVPGKAVIVNVKDPNAMAAGIRRLGTSAWRNRALAIG